MAKKKAKAGSAKGKPTKVRKEKEVMHERKEMKKYRKMKC